MTAPQCFVGILQVSPQTSSRIAAAYVLYSLYSTHSISINPFHSVLLEAFNVENQLHSSIDTQPALTNPQLTWVLWKILNGQGQEVRRYYFHE
jgi:hypothetical protein